MADWLAGRRGEVAADLILDAADALFARKDAATVGMHEIAAAAGCSRATLYRYFENRDALYTAYVHREARRVYQEVSDQVVGIGDPAERLMEGVITALRAVRCSPALSSWFAATQRPIGGEMAEHSEVIRALVEGFVRSLGSPTDADDDAAVGRRARWLVRVMVSLLVFPGVDEADERTMLADFVAPLVVGAQAAQ
ncbi:TetR/AcrR family transcriptional regulator [Mycolicibacterium smegmatis]|jgi:AcrR family transcriptional regulator|uniref:Transcriptional regulator, TetR family protein n=2 Tax=Mycolicibacterium smegmatis (strain ATCC 700084 / mc(2)155) TaxID=246196 RepID=A0R2A1_MYCS2|nr:TetR/AcrR family transcriptional regulator [Mycolicibacterium smegmatis]ABK72395.1 transcriptional regulator, TetR family protein [Mycolicibacterium smegmatis MC2 155]AFP41356.1 Transcriptional regulator, TetR family [Mycolicibacterium smegmatis MC2 155]AIU10077.1 TetR family transcriptional regulator [Mycolicibacterium smegmatis MC2 155]AIU16702.1 TetR family transcriptional regulator [Mycolicibacterium smegmatis]AIU23325.1 TetR family transcriptional regulator [Mycolicibacterium smegmatis